MVAETYRSTHILFHGPCLNVLEFSVWQARVNTIHLTWIPWVYMSLPFWLKGLAKLANLFPPTLTCATHPCWDAWLRRTCSEAPAAGLACKHGTHTCAALFKGGRTCGGSHPGGECRQKKRLMNQEEYAAHGATPPVQLDEAGSSTALLAPPAPYRPPQASPPRGDGQG